jgi:phosphoglycerate dehydrogenase-like enzyme
VSETPSLERRLIAVAPDPLKVPTLVEAVHRGGGELVPPGEASAIIWSRPTRASELRALLSAQHRWVQLPFAGVENFAEVLDGDRLWTCGKRVYARAVAEHGLALILGLRREIVHYARQTGWSRPIGRNLIGERVTILGAGGICDELIALLAPFDCRINVLRRRSGPVAGAQFVGTLHDLPQVLSETDVLVLALALTPETVGVIGRRELDLLPAQALLVNLARGPHVDTDALVTALREQRLGGAGLDVTDPEPLPDGHPLWSEPRCVVTPHTANTPEMGAVLLAEAVEANVRRWVDGATPIGAVDPDAGY